MGMACNNCKKYFDEEDAISVRYHPDEAACPHCGSSKVVGFMDDDSERCYC